MKVGFFFNLCKTICEGYSCQAPCKKKIFKLKIFFFFFFGSCFQGSQKISQGGSIKRGVFFFWFFLVSIITCRAIKGLGLLELVHRSIPW